MIRILICTVFLFFGDVALEAQVIFNEPSSLKVALQRYISENRATTEIDGWRILVLATSDRRQMEQNYQRFRELFPDISVEWVHEQPYYRIKAGAFEKRREALPLCQEIRQYFTQALPVTERVEIEEIIKNK